MKISYYADKKVPFYKKKQFLTTVVGLFFIMLMALSAVQFNQAGPESGEERVINGLTFIDTTSGWRADLDSGPLYLQSEPSSLEDVGAEEVDFSIFSLSSKVYVSLDPYDSVAKSAAAEILRNVVMPVQVVYSCYEDSEV